MFSTTWFARSVVESVDEGVPCGIEFLISGLLLFPATQPVLARQRLMIGEENPSFLQRFMAC
jgi:hypothetical protein